MSDAREIRVLHRGESKRAAVDFGDSTADAKSGVLASGDTVATATVAVLTKPTGAGDFTFGAAAPNGSTEYIKERACAAGEAVLFRVTAASDQVYGSYTVLITAATTGLDTHKRKIVIEVEP